jgi:hypothetical protein
MEAGGSAHFAREFTAFLSICSKSRAAVREAFRLAFVLSWWDDPLTEPTKGVLMAPAAAFWLCRNSGSGEQGAGHGRERE